MISNQILQSTLDGLKAIARVELCVIDVDGKTAATTADGLEEYLPQARAFVDSPADSQEVQGNQFFKIYDEQQLEYIPVSYTHLDVYKRQVKDCGQFWSGCSLYRRRGVWTAGKGEEFFPGGYGGGDRLCA